MLMLLGASNYINIRVSSYVLKTFRIIFHFIIPLFFFQICLEKYCFFKKLIKLKHAVYNILDFNVFVECYRFDRIGFSSVRSSNVFGL